jgi:SRSO17 transposase
METEDFERIYDSFCAFHAEFAPDFGRKQWREHGRDYLQGLLVQAEERRNAENLSEALSVSAHSLQRFLTDARWDDERVITHLQAYLAPRLAHPEAVWAVDSSGFLKQGKRSVGVAHQYCGAVGKVANCQVGVFLAHVGPRGRALVDQRLFLPEAWTNDPERCDAAGVPKAEQVYRSQTELALSMLQRAKARGDLAAEWVTGDDAFGMSPEFRDAVAAGGWCYVLEVPADTPVWPLEPTWETPVYSGRGRPPEPRVVTNGRQTVAERAATLPPEAWQELTVAEGAQGPRPYRFAAERVRETRKRQPGQILWLIHRQNRDGSEPRYYFSNAPAETALATLARVAAARWPIETEFEVEKSEVGLDEYEVRGWSGWQHHITMCFLASAFLLTIQQEWGEKDAPHHPAAGVPGRAGDAAAGTLYARRATALAGGYAAAQRASETVAFQAAGSPTATGIYLKPGVVVEGG